MNVGVWMDRGRRRCFLRGRRPRAARLRGFASVPHSPQLRFDRKDSILAVRRPANSVDNRSAAPGSDRCSSAIGRMFFTNPFGNCPAAIRFSARRGKKRFRQRIGQSFGSAAPRQAGEWSRCMASGRSGLSAAACGWVRTVRSGVGRHPPAIARQAGSLPPKRRHVGPEIAGPSACSCCTCVEEMLDDQIAEPDCRDRRVRRRLQQAIVSGVSYAGIACRKSASVASRSAVAVKARAGGPNALTASRQHVQSRRIRLPRKCPAVAFVIVLRRLFGRAVAARAAGCQSG